MPFGLLQEARLRRVQAAECSGDRRAQTQEQQDEERRMLYTGITRAEVKLWLTHSPIKIYGVHQVYDQPRKFLDTDEVRAALKTVPSS